MAQPFHASAAHSTVPSRWPADGSWLDLLDKKLSSPLFQLQLGLPLEICLSVPGCFFGMPAALALSPSLMAAAHTHSAAPLGTGHWATNTAIALGALLLGAWGYVVFASSGRVARMLFSMRACVFGPAIGMWLVESNPAFDALARSKAHLMLLAWFIALAPTLVGKRQTRRRRPIVCKAEQIGEATVAAAAHKGPRIIPLMLSRDSNAATPSGDAVGALVFSYFLHQSGFRWCARACTLASCSGRVYWHAHHLMDVTIGAAIGAGISVVLDRAFVGATWWQAAAAELGLVLVAILCGTHNEHKHKAR
jgi:membrane-associated phospholipid phosphatase